MLSVMIVDDEELICEGLRSKISRLGLEEIDRIMIASNGLQALQMTNTEDPDIVLTDIRMPEMDGISLIQQLAARTIPPRIIVLSGYDDYEYVRDAFKYGIQDYLLKPVGSTELKDQLDAAIHFIMDHRERVTSIELTSLVDPRLRLEAKLQLTVHKSTSEMESIYTDEIAAYFPLPFFGVGLFSLHPIEEAFKHWNDLYFITNQCLSKAGLNSNQIHSELLEGTGQLFLLLNVNPSPNLTLILEALRIAVLEMRLIGLEVTACWEGFLENAASIPSLYKDASETLPYRLLYPTEPVIIHENRQSGALPLSRQKIEQLRDDIRKLNLIEMRKFTEHWLEPSALRGVAIDQIRKLYELIIHEAQSHFNVQRLFNEAVQFKPFDRFLNLSDIRTELMSRLYQIKQTLETISQNSSGEVEMAKLYLQEHYQRDITLSEVANYVSMNYSYFSKLFKEYTNMTFTQYLMKLRMEKANQLLKDPTYRINEIASKVGYDNLYHFSRAYKNYYGISPKEARVR